MKKIPLLAWLFACTTGAFGLGLSYGGGGAMVFSPVTFNGTYSGSSSQVTSIVSLAAMQFLDATYVQLDIGYALNRGSTEPTAASTTTGFAALLTGLSFGVSLKYPFVIGPVAIFPIIGAEYIINLAYSDDKSDDLKAGLAGPGSALDELWVKAGIGVDVYFGNLFVRPVILAGIMPLNPNGTAVLSSTQPTGTISVTRGGLSVELHILFGCRF
jgi:hypothetical protein